MKKVLFILLSISFFGFSACKKKEKAEPKFNAGNRFANSFSLKHNGVLYTTYSPDVNTNNSWIGITAGTLGETGNYYQIGIKKNLLSGTYEYQGGIEDVMSFIILSDQLTYIVDHGFITVLSNDTILKQMKFNFEFEMLEDNTHSDTILITQGHATVSY